MPDLHDEAFRALLEHNERVRAGDVSAAHRRGKKLIVPAGVVLVLAGAGTATWATGALDNRVSSADSNTGAYIDRGALTPPGLHPSTASQTTTAATTTVATTTARSTTLASVDGGTGSSQLSLTIPDQAAGATSLTMRATRGDSWVEVRLGSSTGRLLQIGTMSEGASSTVQGSRLWVRFGNVGNLDLLVNGKPVHPSRLGTITVIATPGGLKLQG